MVKFEMADNKNVYIVDDDGALRDSLGILLRTHRIASREFSSALGMLAELDSLPSGCALIDINMPGMSGLELLAVLNASKTGFTCIMMTGLGDVATAVRAMKMGAVDFIEKPFEGDALVEIVRRAMERKLDNANFFDFSSEADARVGALTRREKDVMMGIARGNPNKIIAYELGISSRTVETHRSRVMEKLDADSVADVVRLAIAARLLI
jgi:two-component system, LuxR family, response regulator FixJ